MMLCGDRIPADVYRACRASIPYSTVAESPPDLVDRSITTAGRLFLPPPWFALGNQLRPIRIEAPKQVMARGVSRPRHILFGSRRPPPACNRVRARSDASTRARRCNIGRARPSHGEEKLATSYALIIHERVPVERRPMEWQVRNAVPSKLTEPVPIVREMPGHPTDCTSKRRFFVSLGMAGVSPSRKSREACRTAGGANRPV